MARKLKSYWFVYGGIISIIDSIYFWLSVLIVITNNALWANIPGNRTHRWSQLTLDVIPSLMGFALGGMAIMLSFSSGRFLEAIRQSGHEKSYFLKAVASFSHFVFVSTFALILSLIDETYDHSVLNFCGSLAFVYSLLLVPATAVTLWSTANIFNASTESSDGSQK